MQGVASSIDRYQVVRRIGAGGMGVVYEADDLERGQKVALKTISNPDVEKIYQLKREFRALADLSHPNLVALYDLVVAADSCFFTMELLDGVDLLAYLWGRKVNDPDEIITSTPTVPLAPAARPPPTEPVRESGIIITQSAPQATPCDLGRLRLVLPQLARGLHALHSAGKIHRDVKPSNIQVTSDGRAVLLDFGLVAELERRQSGDGMIVGTVAYMAPEQCAGDVQLTAAADWYALGVVVFQALTGRLPFEGVPARVLFEKQTEPAPRPSLLVQHIPRDLDDLCADLLERDPADRPTGAQLLRRLGVAETDRIVSPLLSVSREGGFTGREGELAMLDDALAPLVKRRASVVLVRAPSGMGKTSLVTRFLERLRATHPNAVLLRGRCLDREDVPYKAIDHLIDELSDWWLAQAPKEAQALLPRDAYLLPTLFPVLDRVPAIADAPRTRIVADPQARRTHAFNALRETLQRLGDRHTVVLFLDDMQWVDRDTTALLADLSEWWRDQSPREAQAILPRDAYMLPTLFPVLGRVAAIADAPRTRGVLDPQARRTHAFEALREALQRLSDRRTLVLFLDDMQWVDRDTTTLLADVMRAPDPPPLLLVLATRADDSEPVLSLVRRMDADYTIVDVGPLPEDVAVALAVSQLRDGNDTDDEIARRLVREAQGSPFFLIELTRYQQGRSLAEIAGKGLDAMLLERKNGLPCASRTRDRKSVV